MNIYLYMYIYIYIYIYINMCIGYLGFKGTCRCTMMRLL